MICRHKLYHFTVANLVLPRRVSLIMVISDNRNDNAHKPVDNAGGDCHQNRISLFDT